MENRTTAPEVLEEAMSEIARTNGKILEEHLGELVRSTVEETFIYCIIETAEGGCGCFFGLLCGQIQAPSVFQRTLRTQR